MADDVKKCIWFLKLKSSDRQLIADLRTAQQNQGDMDILVTQERPKHRRNTMKSKRQTRLEAFKQKSKSDIVEDNSPVVKVNVSLLDVCSMQNKYQVD